MKPWVVYAVSWNGRDFYHRVYSHFDFQSTLRDFTVLQGKPWQGATVRISPTILNISNRELFNMLQSHISK